MSWPTITVQGAVITLARLLSMTRGPRRALPASVVTKTKRPGEPFIEVGPYFTSS